MFRNGAAEVREIVCRDTENQLLVSLSWTLVHTCPVIGNLSIPTPSQGIDFVTNSIHLL